MYLLVCLPSAPALKEVSGLAVDLDVTFLTCGFTPDVEFRQKNVLSGPYNGSRSLFRMHATSSHNHTVAFVDGQLASYIRDFRRFTSGL
jgi:hypothetical protein